MSCKECVHYSVCGYVEFQDLECNHFKNKADFVEVVRCKNCINRIEFDTNKFHCELTGYYCGETGYCSDGTPKERGGEK